MVGLDWDRYLTPPDMSVAAHRARSAAAFAGQRANIGRLCGILHPGTVVCMGAGYLNDIPIDDFIAANADVYFAEWIDGITQQAFRYDLVRQVADQFVCLACACSGDPKKYCRNYEMENRSRSFLFRARESRHCDNFVPAEKDACPSCANYVAGEFPCFLQADITQGVAQHFARQVPSIVERASKPQQAFRYAIHVAARPRAGELVPLPDHSVDFITSSMVASQFDFEPYGYFIRNLVLRFGQPAVERHVDALNSLVETLRDHLFLSQVEGHCREMLRLLKPEGRVYFSIETLHAEHAPGPFFQADVSCKAMTIIGRYFYFDLQTWPDIVTPVRTAMAAGGESVIQSCLLLAKPSHERPQES